jgi:Zn finger protein HypA/HybF involved in hydrogenase expression
MVRCPNCGQKTSGDYCQWCNYPILRGSPRRFGKAKKEANRMQAYCVKCRASKEMKDPKSITMKNGRPATQGTCPTCGTKMFRIGKG